MPGLVTSVRSNALLVLTLRIKTQALSEGSSGGLLQRALKISIRLFTDRVYKKILFYILKITSLVIQVFSFKRGLTSCSYSS